MSPGQSSASSPFRVATGLDSLDGILDGLRSGDNVVWRVGDIEDYRRFVVPFVTASRAAGREIVYLRFGRHRELLPADSAVRRVEVDALGGFESFTSQVWHLIQRHGRGAFYVCDCLSDLLDAWATDVMVGNFFRVVCPLLYELDTVAWFALYPERHSSITLDRIRGTTQVMVDVLRADGELQLQPIKVWQRQSPTMFLPHTLRGRQLEPVVDSFDATRLQAKFEAARGTRQALLDYWDRLFLRAVDALEAGDEAAIAAVQEQILRVLISRDERMLSLARRYLKLDDLVRIRERMVGSGYIGGKSTGMLIARHILRDSDAQFWQRYMQPHDSSYLGSDVYYAFLVHNGLWPAIMRQRSPEGYFAEAAALQRALSRGDFPAETDAELERLLEHYGQYPILVRSSSLQEDGFGNAFAGKYDSVFLVNQGSPEQRLEALQDAIRTVYASSMSEEALRYRQRRGLDRQEEPMALLIQRVNGRMHDSLYLPDAAGVGESQNVFTWHPDMRPDGGMVRLVLGLGTRAVDRIDHDHAWVVALDQPQRQPFRDRDERYRYSQNLVDVLDLSQGGLSTRPLTEVLARTPGLPVARLAERDAAASRRAQELGLTGPVWRLTFAPLLCSDSFLPHLRRLLTTIEAGYEHPVEVEFTLHFRGDELAFNLVQCRPMTGCEQGAGGRLPAELPPERVLFRVCEHFMGGNVDLQITRVIRVDPEVYAGLGLQQRYEVARQVGEQSAAAAERANTLLIGPGRWGTSSPELGVPVPFSAIAGVSVLVEVAEKTGNMLPDLSFGSHFFHNLVEHGITYAALFPARKHNVYHPGILARYGEVTVTGALQVVDLHTPLRVVGDLARRELLAWFVGDEGWP